eukprot:scaffold36812_cov56-Phaeocystis_antarctica.AAC.1
MVMSTAQQQAFERALMDKYSGLHSMMMEADEWGAYSPGGFDLIEAGLSQVDVRQVRAAPWLQSGCSLCAHATAPPHTPLRQPPLGDLSRSFPIDRRTAAMLRTRPTFWTSWRRAWASTSATHWSSACCARPWSLRGWRRWGGCRQLSGGRVRCSS